VMALTLYELSVPTFLQTTRAMSNILDRAKKHCALTGTNPDGYVQVRLHDDMAPFSFQIEAMWHHSVWGVEALKTGAFTPPPLVWPNTFAELQTMSGKAVMMLQAFKPKEVNSWSDKELVIDVYQPVEDDNASASVWSPQTLTFTPETYLLTYSLPNFYFHVVTAYDILRMQGVPIGKGDYQGQLRVK
jgi:uncharacterized protein